MMVLLVVTGVLRRKTRARADTTTPGAITGGQAKAEIWQQLVPCVVVMGTELRVGFVCSASGEGNRDGTACGR